MNKMIFALIFLILASNAVWGYLYVQKTREEAMKPAFEVHSETISLSISNHFSMK